MDNQYLVMEIENLNFKIEQLAKNVSDLQRENDGLVQTINVMSKSIDDLKQKFSSLGQRGNN
ncbi:hypothetical protein [Bacillus thuringiensis]|uniref:hypothetical protein n=1 Tax=Bacillus thuringiensis TaxID=1428 RepID=UPI002AB5CE56|nr:hypothetical protein [Bacillus thuringiensis]MDY8165912.1 hypothetical protein [Bacillus thuringiensis]